MDWTRHFDSVVTFVKENLWFVIGLFLAATVVELIVFLAKRSGGVNWQGFFVAIVTNIMVILGLYIAACICVGTVNFIGEQDLHFATHYYGGFVKTGFFTVLFVIIAIVTFVGAMAKLDEVDSPIGRIIAAALIAGVTALVIMYGVAFLVYVICAFIWFLVRTIFFVIIGIAVSIGLFFVDYWKQVVITLVTPGLVYGLVRALINYIASLREKVFDR